MSESKAGQVGTFRRLEAVIGLSMDAIVVYAAAALAFLVRFDAGIPPAELESVRRLLPLLFLVRLGTYYAAGTYRRSFLFPRGFDASDRIQAWAAGTVILAAVVFFGRLLETSRLVLLYEAVFNLIGIFLWRGVFRAVFRGGKIPAVVVGNRMMAERLNRFLDIEDWEFVVSRTVERCEKFDEPAVFAEASTVTLDELGAWKGKRIFLVADDDALLVASSRPVDLGGCVVLDTEIGTAHQSDLIAKRTLDLIVSLFSMFALIPVMMVIAVLIRLSSPGPAIFLHERAGQFGRRFKMMKFRTMYRDAGGPARTGKGDVRVTPIGRFLRAWSLDELPQLINVLAGEMSLVGPRPEVPEVVDDYPAWRKMVLEAKPGITGLVQILGRDDLTEEEKGRLDLFYTLNRSFEMDVSVLIRTFRAVFRYRGRA